MNIFFKLGFRNLGRNKRRSFLAGLAIGIGLASLMVTDGFWRGMVDNMVETVTETFIGHAQIHHESYTDSGENTFFIKNPEPYLNEIKNNSDVINVTTRIMSQAMVNSAEDSKNVMLVGIDPESEKGISLLSQRMISGNYLDNEDGILIGKRLQERLNVDIGDRIVVTASEVDSGEISQLLFRVSGVFGMGNKQMDEFMIIIHKKRARKLLKMPKGVHEIVFRFKDLQAVDQNLAWINELGKGSEKARSWKEITPQIVAAINMYQVSIGIIGFVLLSLVSLGILNTMFMSLYERIFEFGVLRAVGTRGNEILLMIVSEAMSLAGLSIILGAIIATFFGFIMAYYGIDYSGIEFAEMTFTNKIYYVFNWKQYVYFPLVIFVFTVLVSLYPGIHATRITMAKALRKSL